MAILYCLSFQIFQTFYPSIDYAQVQRGVRMQLAFRAGALGTLIFGLGLLMPAAPAFPSRADASSLACLLLSYLPSSGPWLCLSDLVSLLSPLLACHGLWIFTLVRLVLFSLPIAYKYPAWYVASLWQLLWLVPSFLWLAGRKKSIACAWKACRLVLLCWEFSN